jgi:hypothetical protein
MKNILIGILIIAVAVLAYLYFKPQPAAVSSPTTNSNTVTPTKKLTLYSYNNKVIEYNQNSWNIKENRYCTPAQGNSGVKYDGTPCDLVGLTFVYITGTSGGSDNIYVGGIQPMACADRVSKTKCDDSLALVTNSTKKEVLDFYDYLYTTLK